MPPFTFFSCRSGASQVTQPFSRSSGGPSSCLNRLRKIVFLYLPSASPIALVRNNVLINGLVSRHRPPPRHPTTHPVRVIYYTPSKPLANKILRREKKWLRSISQVSPLVKLAIKLNNYKLIYVYNYIMIATLLFYSAVQSIK